jgi:hypothetical protein
MRAHKLDVEGITNVVHYTFMPLMENSIKASASVFRAEVNDAMLVEMDRKVSNGLQ